MTRFRYENKWRVKPRVTGGATEKRLKRLLKVDSPASVRTTKKLVKFMATFGKVPREGFVINVVKGKL